VRHQRSLAAQAGAMIGNRLEEIGFAWLEDITTPEDFPSLARIAASLSTPLACGEYLYGISAFRHLLAAGGTDIVKIDPFRAGGITGWLKIAALAEGFGLPVVSHLAPEIQVHLIGSIPNGLTVEYMPWRTRLFHEVPRPDKGTLTPPRTPGLGLSFDRQALDRYSSQ
jgi:L-alanine-DL-glutamate epimerase-like enolase superfamily enzyme